MTRNVMFTRPNANSSVDLCLNKNIFEFILVNILIHVIM